MHSACSLSGRQHLAVANLTHVQSIFDGIDSIEEEIHRPPGEFPERFVYGLQERVMISIDKPSEIEKPFLVTEAIFSHIRALLQVTCLACR
jgi:hypothetical protein